MSILHVSLQILHQWAVSAREQPITARMISRPSGIDHGGLARVDSSNKHYFGPIPWHVLAIRDVWNLSQLRVEFLIGFEIGNSLLDQMPRWLNPNMWTANYQELTVDQTKRASDGIGISLLTCYINGPISFSSCGLQCFLQDPHALPLPVLMSFGDCVYLLAFLRQVNCCAHPRPDRCKCWWSESLTKFGRDPCTPKKAHTHLACKRNPWSPRTQKRMRSFLTWWHESLARSPG